VNSKENTRSISQAGWDAAGFMAIYPLLRRIAGARSARALSKFSSATAQDFLQEVLIAIWKALRRYDAGRASVRTFVERVAGARIASLVRTERRQRRVESIDIGQLPARDPVLALELRIDIGCVIASLSVRDRELAELLMEHSPGEVARTGLRGYAARSEPQALAESVRWEGAR
jgi:RNA polymerase sigma factor (sigma-70 family)